MWQAQIGNRTWSSATSDVGRAGRWALLAAAVVVGLPIALVVLAAVLVGAAVFVLLLLISALVRALSGLFNQVRGRDEHGRQNVRVIRRDL